MNLWIKQSLVVSSLLCLSSPNIAEAQQLGWEYNPTSESNDNQLAQVSKADSDAALKSAKAILKEYEKSDPNGSHVTSALTYLAAVYKRQGRYAEAERLYKRVIGIEQKRKGPIPGTLSDKWNELAVLYCLDGKYAEAEPLFKKTLAFGEDSFGPSNLFVALGLNNLAGLYYSEGKYAEAEPLYKRSLAIYEKVLTLGPISPEVAIKLNNLAQFYCKQGKYADAEPLFKRALAIWQNNLAPSYENETVALYNYASLLRKTNREAEAAEMQARATHISPARAKLSLPEKPRDN